MCYAKVAIMCLIMFFARICGWGLQQSCILWFGRKWIGEEGERKQGNRTYSGAKCGTVECWFSVNTNILLNIFACKESSTCEYYTLIHKLGHGNPCLSSASENKVTVLHKELAWTRNNIIWLQMLLWHVLNKLSWYCLAADLLCTDWSLTRRTWLSCQFKWRMLLLSNKECSWK
jgi:hypothetical protein